MRLIAIGFIVLFITFLPLTYLKAQSKKPVITKPPAWVSLPPVHYHNDALDEQAEDGYVDLDFENRYRCRTSVSTTKKALKILSEAGVQNCSELSITFDPAYQRLQLHTVRIIRGAETINQLQLSRIKTIQQEKELNRFIYNGSLTAVMILEDVCKGDVIEYSYTLKGVNPIYRGVYADRFDTRFSVPVYQLYYKLITPSSKTLTIKNVQTPVAPHVSSIATETTYEWKLANVAALSVAGDLPSWYDAYPMIMISEYKSWKQINVWALALFPDPEAAGSSSIEKKAAEIKKVVQRRKAAPWLPSARAFDHVTVRVKVNGSFYYVDPTVSYQRGPLSSLSYPDYQTGLVLTDTTTGLTVIPFRQTGKVTATEEFHILDMSGTARLTVTTHYSGSYADNVRSDFKSNSRGEMQKTYRDFYAPYFEKVQADSLAWREEETSGAFITTEYYTIREFWGRSSSVKKVTFEPYLISSIIKKPKEGQRTLPFNLPFPACYEEDIVVHLPENWQVKESSHSSGCAAFRFASDYSCGGRLLRLHYHYETIKDHVEPEEMSRFFSSINEVNESIAYELTYSQESTTEGGTTGSMLSSHYSSLYALLGLCVFITVLVRKRNGRG